MISPSPTRRQFIAHGVAVGIGLTVGCLSIEKDTRPIDELNTYTSDEYAYAVLYPSSWALDETNPDAVSFSTNPYDGWMESTTHEKIPEADSELTADVWSGLRSQFPNYELLEKQSIELPNGKTGVAIDIQYSSGASDYREKALWIVDTHSHFTIVQHFKTDYTEQFNEMATEIVNSFTIP